MALGVDARPTRRPPHRELAVCTLAEVAWLALLPCALLTFAATMLLGPPLGRALFAPQGMTFFPTALPAVRPEATEHARYGIALLGPVLLAGVVLLAARRPIRAPPYAAGRLVAAVQVLLVAFLFACVWLQRRPIGPPVYSPPQRRAYFTTPTLLVAAAIAIALAAVLSHTATRRRAAALLRESRRRRLAAIAVAVALLGLWLLSAVTTDAAVGAGFPTVGSNLAIWLDEAMAVVNGQPPLVHLQAQYSQLWPYASGATMAALGSSLGVFVATMLAGTAAAMLAVLALLRRVARSWPAALLLFAPFLATSFFRQAGTLADRYTPLQLFSAFPMRYGGPFVLAWLTARHLDGARPRRRGPLFLAAGLVAINNPDFGLPALGATLAALLLAERPGSWGAVARLGRDLALGLAGAAAVVAALTLAVAGSLPHFGTALVFARIYGVEGFGMLPMRALGMPLVVYATFVAAIAAAAVRAARRTEDATLTGSLAWAGVFGLGAGAYFVGHSHPDVLIDLFSAWALALALLLVLVVRDAAGRKRWRPTAPAMAVFAGAGLAVCSLAQTPAPGPQLQRLSRSTPVPVLRPLDEARAIGAQARRGEPIAIFAPLGHRVADDAGVVDVLPFSDVRQLVTRQQLEDAVRALRSAGGTRAVVAGWAVPRELVEALVADGFRPSASSGSPGLEWLEDARAPGR